MTLVCSDAFSDLTSLLTLGKANTHGGPTLRQLKEKYKFDVLIDLNSKLIGIRIP